MFRCIGLDFPGQGEQVLIETKPGKKVRVETLTVYTQTSTNTIGGVPYAPARYTIRLKENGLTAAMVEETLARSKLDFSLPPRMEGRITVEVEASFPVHVEAVVVEEET